MHADSSWPLLYTEVSSGTLHADSGVDAYQAVMSTAIAGQQKSTEGNVSSEGLADVEQRRFKVLPVDAAKADAIAVGQQSITSGTHCNGCDAQQHLSEPYNNSKRLADDSQSGQDSPGLQTGSGVSLVDTHASQAQLKDAQPTVAASVSKRQATAGSKSARSRKGLIKTLARTTPTRAPSIVPGPVLVSRPSQDARCQAADPRVVQQTFPRPPALPSTQPGQMLPASCSDKQSVQHALDWSADSAGNSSRVFRSHQAELGIPSPASSHKSLKQGLGQAVRVARPSNTGSSLTRLKQGSQQTVHVAILASTTASSLTSQQTVTAASPASTVSSFRSLKQGSQKAVRVPSPATAPKAVRRSLLHHPQFH